MLSSCTRMTIISATFTKGEAMEYINKWTGKIYLLVEEDVEAGTVTLQREDGTRLTIDRGELKFNYREKTE